MKIIDGMIQGRDGKYAEIIAALESQPPGKILVLSSDEVSVLGKNTRDSLVCAFNHKYGRGCLRSKFTLEGDLQLQFTGQGKNPRPKGGLTAKSAARRQQIIDAIISDPSETMRSIGKRLGVTGERIRQIRNQAESEGVVFPLPAPRQPVPRYTWEPDPRDPDWRPIIGTDLYAHIDGYIRRKDDRSAINGRRTSTTQVQMPDGRTISRGRLILEAFGYPQPAPNYQVWHKDRQVNNDALSNLEWITTKERAARSVRSAGKNWLDDETVRKIRNHAGRNCEIARQFGLPDAVVSNIRLGKSYRHVAATNGQAETGTEMMP